MSPASLHLLSDLLAAMALVEAGFGSSKVWQELLIWDLLRPSSSSFPPLFALNVHAEADTITPMRAAFLESSLVSTTLSPIVVGLGLTQIYLSSHDVSKAFGLQALSLFIGTGGLHKFGAILWCYIFLNFYLPERQKFHTDSWYDFGADFGALIFTQIFLCAEFWSFEDRCSRVTQKIPQDLGKMCGVPMDCPEWGPYSSSALLSRQHVTQ